MGHEEEIQQENAAPQHPPVPQGQCLHCDHNYTNARGLAAHNRNRHKKIINNECGICGNVFDTHQPIFNSIGRGGIRTHEASVAGVEDDVMDIDDEAVMLEAAMFGGIPEGSGYRLPFAPHHLMQNGLNRVMDRYNQRMPRPPSPSLTAKRLLQEQQDDEYFASLQAGREKELKAKEEAEAALAERRKEEQLRKKLEDEQGIVYLKLFIIILSSSAAYTILDYPHCLLPEKFKEIDRQLAAKEASLPQEPTSDDEIAITLLVRLPDGSRRGRRFLKSDRLQYLFDFIDIGKGVKPGMYRLVMLIVGEAISSTSF